MNVAILFGGESGEHEVSCLSAYSVYRHIDRMQFTPLLIGITPSGEWFFQKEVKIKGEALLIEEKEENRIFLAPGVNFFCNNEKLPIDFIFPILHGTYGEDGTVQGLLELLHLPYAGSGVIGSAVGMDKVLAKRIWQNSAIPVVPFKEIAFSQIKEKIKEQIIEPDFLKKITADFPFPLFVKPVNAGSSVGASKANDEKELQKAIIEAFHYDSRILIEQFIQAREIECALLGNDSPEAFEPGEIKASHEFYDYDAKYNDPQGATLEITAELDQTTKKRIQELAKKAYSAIEAKGFARVDFFIDKKKNEIYLNEINTLPGFTAISMFPKMCEASGIPYQELITKIIKLGIDQFQEKRKKVAHFMKYKLKN